MKHHTIRILIGSVGIILVLVVEATGGTPLQLAMTAIAAVSGLAGYEMLRSET